MYTSQKYNKAEIDNMSYEELVDEYRRYTGRRKYWLNESNRIKYIKKLIVQRKEAYEDEEKRRQLLADYDDEVYI